MMLTPSLRSAADLMPLVPELVLAGGAFALLMLDLFLDERRRAVTQVGAIVLLLVAAGLVVAGVGGAVGEWAGRAWVGAPDWDAPEAAGEVFNWGGPTLTIPAATPAGNYFIGILVERLNLANTRLTSG